MPISRADRLGWSASKVSRVERGLVGISPVELVRFAAHCEAAIGDIDLLLDYCREVTPPGYWLSRRFASLIFHENTATFSSSFDPLVVPGLLQTQEYATALISQERLVPSSFSDSSQTACVEVAFGQGGVAVRDSKNTSGPVLTVSPEGWRALTANLPT